MRQRMTLACAALVWAAGLLYLFFFPGGKSPATFYAVVSVLVVAGAVLSVMSAQRRKASRGALVGASVVGAGLSAVVVYAVAILGVVFFGDG